MFGDVGWRGESTELHLIAMAATASVGASAATPIQLIDRDDRAVYTTPQTTRKPGGPRRVERQAVIG
jgi:iron complex outermembrane receptor protein